MADSNFQPLPQNVLNNPAPHGHWPEHDQARHVRATPAFPAADKADRQVATAAALAAEPGADAAVSDNPLGRGKRWLPLAIPLMAVMLALAGGSILLLET